MNLGPKRPIKRKLSERTGPGAGIYTVHLNMHFRGYQEQILAYSKPLV